MSQKQPKRANLSAVPSVKRRHGPVSQGRTRITVPMEPEVLAIFERMAKAASQPVGRTIADWCRDTADGALFVAQKMAEARKQPALVMRELKAMGGGLLKEIDNATRELAEKRREEP